MNKFLQLIALIPLIAVPQVSEAINRGDINHEDVYAEHKKPVNISAKNLKKMIDDKADFVLIDARAKKYYAEGHIIGAINIPANEVSQETISKIAKDKKAKLVFYCQGVTCGASKIGAIKAQKLGYKYTYEYPGGMEEWQKLGYEVRK